MAKELISSLQMASAQWIAFSLESRKASLDKAISNAKASNTQSQTARKLLAESTKSFKKCVKTTEQSVSMNDEEKAQFQKLSSSCKDIVKSYQEEIDNLTKRCKASDSLVTDLNKGLSEILDPVPLMKNAAEHLDNMSGQVSHLLKGLEEMQRELEFKQKEYSQTVKGHNDEMFQLQKLLEEANSKNKLLEKELKAAKTESSQQKSYMSKEEKEELIELRKEVAEYEVEFKNLKNQDITIKKLNAKIEDLIANQEEELQRELKKAQEHLAQTEGRRATEALEREAAMARKLASLELELRAERAGIEATQASLLEADEGMNEREAAWEAQRQILVDDADRLREQLHEMKRERDDLKIKVEAMREDGVVDKNNVSDVDLSSAQIKDVLAEREAYEAEVNELTSALSAMRDEMKLKDDTMDKLQTSMQATVDSLENERKYLAQKVTDLEAELARSPSAEMINNMRRELRILKKLEFNAVDIDPEKEAPEITMNPHDDESNLESVLISKLRKAEADLVKERREKNSQLQMCEELKIELAKVTEEKNAVDALAARLEADLDKATAAPTAVTTNKSDDIRITINAESTTLQHILDPNAPEPNTNVTTPLPSSDSATDKRNDDHSVATIVMAQRDRLRAKCDALEAERDSFKRELQVQVSTCESLKADNTKLYEKVRYLQSYNNSSGIHARNKASMVDRDLDLEALEQRYEASVDPFKQFSRSERQRKIKEMSPMERTVFFVARTVLGSKEMRTVLFFYVVGMHLLVFFTTYHWSHGCQSVTHQQHVDSMHAGLPDMEEGSQ